MRNLLGEQLGQQGMFVVDSMGSSPILRGEMRAASTATRDGLDRAIADGTSFAVAARAAVWISAPDAGWQEWGEMWQLVTGAMPLWGARRFNA